MGFVMRRRTDAGQALALTALALVVLLGIMGLAIDMGILRYDKRLQQSATDAAAIAGASNLPYDGLGSVGVIIGAQDASAANGFTSISGVTCPSSTADLPQKLAVGVVDVTVCNPPIAGPHTGDPDYVETYVSAGQPTYFMKIFGIGTATITARAVSTNVGGGADSGCLYSLGPPNASIEGVNINGNATLYAPGCGIVDNGNYNTKGSALDLTAATFGMSGNRYSTGNGGTVTCLETPNSCPTPGMPAVRDPLSSLTPPPVGTPQSFDQSNVAPGTYSSINITGNGTVNFPPGIYVLDGGDFTCHGTPTITGTGVMFYFTNGATFNCSGNDTVEFTAPSPANCPESACPAQYDGIVFYQDRSDTSGPTIGGNTGTYYNGLVYVPSAQITFFGNNTSFAVALVVGRSIALSGHPTVNIEGPGGLPTGVSVIKNAVLVE